MTKVEREKDLDLGALLHPARAFGHPREILEDGDLTLNEKRAILASWASDACAMEAAPQMRETVGGNIVPFDDIMDALRALDRSEAAASHRYRRLSRRRRLLDGTADRAASVQ